MIEPSDSDWAYAAGFFEGEGHVRIQNHSRRSRCFHMQITAVQSTEEPIYWMQERFGGTVSRRLMNYRGTKRALFTWQASNRVAERFLRGIYKYCRVKVDEIDVALRFMGMKRDQSGGGGRQRLTEEEVNARLECFHLIKRLRIEKRASARDMLLNE